MNQHERAVIEAALVHDDAIRTVHSALESIDKSRDAEGVPSTAMLMVLQLAEEEHAAADYQLDVACDGLREWRAEKGMDMPAVFFEWAFWAVVVVAAGSLALVLTA